MPTPQQCGLPERVTAWRPTQEQALPFLWGSQKRVKSVCIPPGGGKTWLAIADALRSKKPTCIVTHSRGLQDLYMEHGAELGMADLRGRNNYPCMLHPEVPGYSCDQGYVARCPHKGTHRCAASAAEMTAATSWLVVTNYEKWIHSRKFGIGLKHIEKVILDEGHESYNALAGAMQITLHEHEINDTLKLDFPDSHEAEFFASWRVWAAMAREKAHEKMKAAEQKLKDGDAKGSVAKHFTHMRNLVRRLSILATANPANWIVDEVEKGYQFDPIAPGRYLESALLLKVPDVTLISGTLTLKTLYMIGMPKNSFDFMDYPSEFDAARCPIYYVPTMKVDSKSGDLGPLWLRLDQFAAPRRDRNGLVHSVSFMRRDEAIERSRMLQEARSKGKLFYNERGEAATQTIADFVDAYPGAILISPSVGQGFDFYGRRAEWQFIPKLPFPPPTKILKARCDPQMGGDEEHAFYLTWLKLVQSCGRVMRDRKDQGETLIADDNMQWMYKFRHLAPKSFGQFFKPVATLPPPPERLRSSSFRD